jgi:hypothetical protein
MTKKENNILRNKIMKGIQLAIKKLIDISKKNDEELIVYKNGKIVSVKAKNIK